MEKEEDLDIYAHGLSEIASVHAFLPKWSREVSSCIVKKHEPDVHRVAVSIIKTKGVTAEKAFEEATVSKHYKKYIRGSTRPDGAEQLQAVCDKFLQLSLEAEERGERPLFQQRAGAS
eukprot:g3162.t1